MCVCVWEPVALKHARRPSRRYGEPAHHLMRFAPQTDVAHCLQASAAMHSASRGTACTPPRFATSPSRAESICAASPRLQATRRSGNNVGASAHFLGILSDTRCDIAAKWVVKKPPSLVGEPPKLLGP